MAWQTIIPDLLEQALIEFNVTKEQAAAAARWIVAVADTFRHHRWLDPSGLWVCNWFH